MKQQSVTQMIKDVRVILEESVNSASLEGVTDVGSISINDVIKGVLTKAVTAVANVAPMELFNEPSYQRLIVMDADGIYVPYTFIGTKEDAHIVEIPYVASRNVTISATIQGDLVGTIPTTANGKVIVSLSAATDHVSGTIRITNAAGTKVLAEVNITQDSQYTPDVYENNEYTGAAWKFTAYNGGYFNKPSDYLRTLFVQNAAWQRSVTELTGLSSPFVSIARSEINLSVGNAEKPLVVDSFVNGKGSLEIYPAEIDESVDFVYIEQSKITKVDNKEYINCDDGIYHAATLYAAYIVAMIKGYQNADGYKNAAMEAIQQLTAPTNATAGAPVEQ